MPKQSKGTFLLDFAISDVVIVRKSKVMLMFLLAKVQMIALKSSLKRTHCKLKKELWKMLVSYNEEFKSSLI